jgi:hypothetical protein
MFSISYGNKAASSSVSDINGYVIIGKLLAVYIYEHRYTELLFCRVAYTELLLCRVACTRSEVP